MNYLSILELYAELAIAVVGFSGVVVALQSTRLLRDPLARIQLSILFSYGVSGIVWSVLAQVFLTSAIEEVLVWRFLSLSFVVIMIGFAIYRSWQSRQAANTLNFAGRAFPILAVLQMATLGANVYLASGMLFMICLLSNLIISLLLFAQLIWVKEDA